MLTGFNALIGIIVLFVIAAVATAVTAYFRFRGTRVIECPETHEPHAVEINAVRGAMEELVTEPHLKLRSCTRWPERQDCGQECIAQIEDDPNGCLVVAILDDWYRGKECAFCHKKFEEIHWHDHKPALLSPEKALVDWGHVPPRELYQYLETHQPVCWNCYIAETFRHDHPDLVVDRDWNRDEVGQYTDQTR